MAPTFLHGRLSIEVIAARNVENRTGKGGFFRNMKDKVRGTGEGIDPYCSVRVAYVNVAQTRVVWNNPNPSWEMSCDFACSHETPNVEFRVKAAKRKGALGLLSKVKHLSMVSIPAEKIKEEKIVEGWFPLTDYNAAPDEDEESDSDDSDKGKDREHGELQLRIEFTPIEEVCESLSTVALPNAYYEARQGCNVTLYQNAEVTPNTLPTIPFAPEFKHSRCWVDIAHAIMASPKFVYITGWAVWPDLVPVRTEGDLFCGMTLGEMLKQKAEEGVTVRVLVWDELASNMFSDGLMVTHDEALVKYFSGTDVVAVKAPRQNAARGAFADWNDSMMFTHHQKTVVVSRKDDDSGKHRVEAFVGGLDLTDGRYDNLDFSLFRSIKGVHAPPDFWQACALQTGAESGPREPWRDIHSKVTGAAAWDVLENFTTRWARQAKGELHELTDDEFVTVEEEVALADGGWSVQLLRSINQCSAELNAYRPGLVARHSALVDHSIHNAYVHAIRRAKSHIYIENQYFLGSSHMWDPTTGERGGFASHLVAIELAEKICAKIRAGERFAAYVCVPLHPEGPPDSAAVQQILSHQKRTVSMITQRIAAALTEMGGEGEIGDYFNLFCLANRESAEGGMGNGGTTAQEKTLSASRRFMIYVHSKFAIFDDEVAIVGSANINSRSMDGSRDSEIATMSWQPEHAATGPTGYGQNQGEETCIPKGDIAAFRCSIWTTLLGGYDEDWENPASLACVKKVRKLSQANWANFARKGSEPTDMPHGFLSFYPYHYDPVSGEAMPSTEHIPDFPGALVGGKLGALPLMLTG